VKLRDELEIDAPAETVWALTIDIESWPQTTPTITSVDRLDDGPVVVGSRARLKQPRQPAAVWTVTRLEPGSVFEWSTRTLGMTMTGGHRIEPLPDGRCRNVLTLSATGLSAALLGWLVARPIRQAIATENAGIKRRAEAARRR
jgi:uncharacterized membrane protein